MSAEDVCKTPLEDYIATLSRDELKRHRKLIDECRTRDRFLRQEEEQAQALCTDLSRATSNFLSACRIMELSSSCLLACIGSIYLSLIDTEKLARS